MQLLSAGLLHHSEHAVAVQTMDAARHHHGDVPGTAQTMGGTLQDASQFQSVCVVVQHWLFISLTAISTCLGQDSFQWQFCHALC